MNVPDDIGYRAMTRSQKKIVHMWFGLGLKIEIRPIGSHPAYNCWRLASDGLKSIHLQVHELDWRVRLKQ
jgi:hypothetical protein